ncbi:MAG: hypothetical protein Q9163_006133, partial [Psora crenata]
NDITSHKQGKQHKLALARVDETLRVDLESNCFKEETFDPKYTGGKGGNGQAAPTATSPNPNPQKSGSSAPHASTDAGTAEASKPPRRAQKKKGKAPAKPRQFGGQHARWVTGFSQIDTYTEDVDYSICDKGCGWCGRCMDNVDI